MVKTIRSPPIDIISELPSNIIEIILMFLPLQVAMRTSILSSKWRYRWANLTELVIDDSFNLKSVRDPRDIVMKIYEILLLHQGPILKFTLDISGLKGCLEIDRMMLFLSRNGLQELTLCLSDKKCHKLPSYIFSCQQLTNLKLRSCIFEQPPTFKGFRKLITLELMEVKLAPDVLISDCPVLERLTLKSATTIDFLSIDAPNLKFLCFKGHAKYIGLINTPLLAVLSLTSDDDGIFWESFTDFMSGCVPYIENLHMCDVFLKLLAVGNVPEKLPTMLNYLRVLELFDISSTEMGELSSALCLIRSSPNLQKLKVAMAYFETIVFDVEPALEYWGMQDYSDGSLNNLREVEFQDFTGLRSELEFIKFVLSISPKLETLYIKPCSSETIKSGYKKLMELKRFRRASQKAEIIFVGVDDDQT